ncbi:MAG: Uma2 family endonuclease [Firmicutes bacterium]|nr:Uma2 family endonuclease [Bacillota bacterium]
MTDRDKYPSIIKEAEVAYNYDAMADDVTEEKDRDDNVESEISAVKKNRPMKKPGEYTIDDYDAWPEDERIELIDGRIYFMGAPTLVHQLIAGVVYTKISNFIFGRDGSCMPGISPIDVQLDNDEKTVVQPDVIIDCRDKRDSIKRVIGAPDFVLEVLSPSTRRKDKELKTEKYRNAGCREYWIVDPENETVTVIDFERGGEQAEYTFDEAVHVTIYSGELEIDFKEIKMQLEKYFG